jgi:hypothetical protein
MTRFRLGLIATLLGLGLAPSLARADSTFLGRFSALSLFAPTVPANGDVNPYGVAVVPRSIGNETRGNVLVSNFNNNVGTSGQQGRGTTIVQVSPGGSVSPFAQINAASITCPGGVGLTTALVILSGGWVVVGSLPTTDGMSTSMKSGCLIVLNSKGHVAETLHGGNINGPWDMTATSADEGATLYFTNVLNGDVAHKTTEVDQGTVVRMRLALEDQMMPKMIDSTIIGSDFPEQADPNALVIGPTGVALSSGEGDENGDNGNGERHGGEGNGNTLYVADSLKNRIAAIPNADTRTSSAGTGNTIFSGAPLNDPLGLALAPNGHIVTANGNDGLLVETPPGGSQVTHFDTGLGGGSLFGIAVKPGGKGLYLVDDGNNRLDLLS